MTFVGIDKSLNRARRLKEASLLILF
jgi:hypothetical protein